MIAYALAVSTVLLSLHSTHSLGNFFRLIDNKPDAAALLQVYAKENDVELLRDFYYQDDRRVESGILALKESLAIEVSLFVCLPHLLPVLRLFLVLNLMTALLSTRSRTLVIR